VTVSDEAVAENAVDAFKRLGNARERLSAFEMHLGVATSLKLPCLPELYFQSTQSLSLSSFPIHPKTKTTLPSTTNPVNHRGLGAVIAQKFAAQGSNIAINFYSRLAEAEALSAQIQKDYGVKTTLIQGDAGVIADVKFMVHETIKVLGGLDVIVGNAVSFSSFSLS
jgi:hypothetical protein